MSIPVEPSTTGEVDEGLGLSKKLEVLHLEPFAPGDSDPASDLAIAQKAWHDATEKLEAVLRQKRASKPDLDLHKAMDESEGQTTPLILH